MLKLGLVGQHITKSLTQIFFQELSEIYNIELSYELFDMFNQINIISIIYSLNVSFANQATS